MLIETNSPSRDEVIQRLSAIDLNFDDYMATIKGWLDLRMGAWEYMWAGNDMTPIIVNCKWDESMKKCYGALRCMLDKPYHVTTRTEQVVEAVDLHTKAVVADLWYETLSLYRLAEEMGLYQPGQSDSRRLENKRRELCQLARKYGLSICSGEGLMKDAQGVNVRLDDLVAFRQLEREATEKNYYIPDENFPKVIEASERLFETMDLFWEARRRGAHDLWWDTSQQCRSLAH